VPFAEALRVGQVGEGDILRYLNAVGYNVLPAYEPLPGTYRGPQLFVPGGRQLILPDLLIWRVGEAGTFRWVEAKRKTAWTWHRATSEWVTGIDRRVWREYVQIEEASGIPVWVMFLQAPGGVAKDTPEGVGEGPEGLFSQSLARLQERVHHEHDRGGPSGMLYWTPEAFRRLCSFEDCIAQGHPTP
jgi:hypothetical protein